MPAESQLLYFHMVLRADDDGIVESYPLLKLLGLATDNFKVLQAKGFIRQLNEDQVIVIIDWREHNVIRADRKVNSIYQNLLLEKVPDIEVLRPKPRSDVDDNSRRLLSGQSTDGISKVKLSKVKLSKVNNIANFKNSPNNEFKKVIEQFYTLKGWPLDGDSKLFARYLRSAKELYRLCDNDLKEAQECLEKIKNWAVSRNLDWSIETVFKKWYDLDFLKPKEKKPYIDNMRAFQKVENGKWYVISKDGEIKEYGIKPSEIIYK